MGTHSVVEAESRLSELIDRALAGESVVITRDDRPVIELRPLPPAPEGKPVTAEALDRLKELRAKLRPRHEDAGALLGRMRDEWQR